MDDLKDIEWCFLDLLMRAKSKGLGRVNRLEILRSDALPQRASAQLVFAGLCLANGDLVDMHGPHDFEITKSGEEAYQLRFGRKSEPTDVADTVICLPGPDGKLN